MKAIILAAGKGTRLQPLTLKLPKPLLTVGHQTILDHIIENLPDQIDEIIIVTKYLEEKIQDHIESQVTSKKYKGHIKIQTISQGQVSGTYGALLSVKDMIAPSERFMVMNSDDLQDKSELTGYLEYPLAFGIQKRVMPAYYASEPDTDGIIRKFRQQTEDEKVQGAHIATGVYILDDKIFSFPPVTIYGGEIGLPQTIIAQTETYPLHAVRTTKWHPINNFDDLEEAEKRFL